MVSVIHLWKGALLFLFLGQVCSRSIGQVRMAMYEEDQWVPLTTKIIQKEMVECSLLVVFDNDNYAHSLLNFNSMSGKGMTIINVANLAATNLQFFKEQQLQKDARSCQNLVIIYTDSILQSLRSEMEKFWAGHQKILIVSLSSNGANVKSQLLLQPSFRFSAQVALLESKDKKIWDVYNLFVFKGKNRQTVQLVNRWYPHLGFRKDALVFSPSKLQDFEGYDFAVAALPYSPFVINNELTQSDIKSCPKRYRGMEVDFLNSLSKGANFTYHFVAPEDRQWGRELDNGSWTGMIGMVGKEEAHWAISDITFSLKRLSYIDFTDTIIYDASELITPRALPLPLWQGPTRPFTGEVWIATIIFTISVSILITLMSRFSPNTNSDQSYYSSFARSFLYCFQIILMRGGKGSTDVTSVRIFLGIWLLSAMIINMSYTSSLTSFLILPGYTKPIENFEQLVKSEIGWAKVDFGGVQNNYLQSADDPVLRALAGRVEWSKSLDDVLKRVVEGEIATWENAITTKLKVAVEYTNMDGQPLVSFTGTSLLLERVVWPLQKHAPYKKRLDEIIRRIVESGLLSKFYSDIIFEETLSTLKNNKRTTEEEESGHVVLTLQHFQGPFFILLFGYIFSFVLLMVEFSVNIAKSYPSKSSDN